MTEGTPPARERPNPIEREARWDLIVRIAIKATDEREAETILSDALTSLRKELPLQAVPLVHSRRPRSPDDIWIAVLKPDLTHLQVIEPDDAPTHCSLVMNYFPLDAEWTVTENSALEARREWPPEIWVPPLKGDVLLHPSVRAVMISCKQVSLCS